MQQAEDFRAESQALFNLLERIEPGRFVETTQFKEWTINDVLQHLHFWNEMARLQIEDEEELSSRLSQVMKEGASLREFEKRFLGGLAGNALLKSWQEEFNRTAKVFAKADPKARLKWAGPDMSARSSITARLMETWAHGQEIYDHLGVERENKDRIQNIVVLGVNTFNWTYKTRGEQPPGEMPELRLTAPSGEVWTYGTPSSSGLIEGTAADFCQVVTQTRNIADTALNVTGDIAEDWMSKAQCFAGAPNPPPPPGTRFRRAVSD